MSKHRKIHIDLDDLRVESFETTPRWDEKGGTVLGYAPPTAPETCEGSCNPKLYSCGVVSACFDDCPFSESPDCTTGVYLCCDEPSCGPIC